jgi:phosphopantothenoylcysteine decarboxylase
MRKNLLLCCSGSIATLKLPELYCCLFEDGRFNIRIVLTNTSQHFHQNSEFYNLEIFQKFVKYGGNDCIFSDIDEWKWSNMNDPILHIELRKWADILVLAPASANCISKIVCGQCDSLLLSIIRAWDNQNIKKQLFFAPAMNNLMFDNPLTKVHIMTMSNDMNWVYIPPIKKKLACGDFGYGAMASVENIISIIRQWIDDQIPISSSKLNEQEIKDTNDINKIEILLKDWSKRSLIMERRSTWIWTWLYDCMDKFYIIYSNDKYLCMNIILFLIIAYSIGYHNGNSNTIVY